MAGRAEILRRTFWNKEKKYVNAVERNNGNQGPEAKPAV